MQNHRLLTALAVSAAFLIVPLRADPDPVCLAGCGSAAGSCISSATDAYNAARDACDIDYPDDPDHETCISSANIAFSNADASCSWAYFACTLNCEFQ